MFHPVTVITSFLVTVVALAFPYLSTLLFAAVLLAVAYAHCGWGRLRSAVVMVKRMRWFLISIMVIYCWLTPGDTIVEVRSLSSWLPTWQGVVDGTGRVVALLLVITSVNLLLRILSRDELLTAIVYLARPLRIVGVQPEVVALRITLVIDAVGDVQRVVASHLPEKGAIPFRPATIGVLAAQVFDAVLQQSEKRVQEQVELPEFSHPAAIEWLVPSVLLLGFYLSVQL